MLEEHTATNRILIADDDDASVDLLLRRCSPGLGSCDVCSDGTDALKMFKENFNSVQSYNVLLLDIEMPIMDGTTVVEQVREIEREANIQKSHACKIIMTTAHDDEALIREWFTEEFDGYLVKPYAKSDLLEMFKKLNLIA